MCQSVGRDPTWNVPTRIFCQVPDADLWPGCPIWAVATWLNRVLAIAAEPPHLCDISYDYMSGASRVLAKAADPSGHK